ncbi:MAG TPA: hypothetical protein PK466_09655 [Thermotogota bacterium]|nr:hypothetical protein [Thermotogota bacterium]HPJ89390.1 hypothetical protein [Thermotogota bacterium]HPR96586.1 hypothetical protein [Thermotogota bacterium]
MIEKNLRKKAAEKKKEISKRLFLSKAIYGTLIVHSVLLSLEDQENSIPKVILLVLLSSIIIVIAEVYSETIAEIVNKDRGLTKKEFLLVVGKTLPVLYASQVPTLVFVIARILDIQLSTAFMVTKISGILTLFTYGLLVGRKLFSDNRRYSIYTALITAGIGYGIIIIKMFLH